MLFNTASVSYTGVHKGVSVGTVSTFPIKNAFPRFIPQSQLKHLDLCHSCVFFFTCFVPVSFFCTHSLKAELMRTTGIITFFWLPFHFYYFSVCSWFHCEPPNSFLIYLLLVYICYYWGNRSSEVDGAGPWGRRQENQGTQLGGEGGAWALKCMKGPIRN